MTQQQIAKAVITWKIQSELQEAEDFAVMYYDYWQRYLADKSEKNAEIYKNYHFEQTALATEWKLLLECYQ